MRDTVTAALVFVILAAIFYAKSKRQRNPPGPKPLPLIGNLFDFPSHSPWLTYDKWKKQYGDINYMNIMGTPIVVLNSAQACTDLFDKRSSKYSSRPRLVMLVELMGWSYNIAMMSYSPRWRKHRRLLHQYFNESASANHRSVQQQCTYAFLVRIQKEPEQLLEHVRLHFGETMTEIMYGLKVKGLDDTFLHYAHETMKSVMAAGVPGRYLVDVFPILKNIPAWFPGAAFKRQAQVWKNIADNARDIPLAEVKKQMGKGDARPSIVTSMLGLDDEAFKGAPQDLDTPDETVKGLAITTFLGGADTSISSIQSFFLAIANHPEAQKAAQVEIDALLGGSRLPTFEDIKDLPFVNAIVKELLRWHNTAPLGIAHYLTEDDEYNGYILRKGSIVLGNIWSILHDPEVYSDPLTFNPWRWIVNTPDGIKLNQTLPDSSDAVFGYGRRICPGRFFAANSLFIVVASVLACFDIRPLDSKRQPVDKLEQRFTDGLLTYPEDFNVSITLRSERAARLLKEIEQQGDGI